jgi:hypothetical protein
LAVLFTSGLFTRQEGDDLLEFIGAGGGEKVIGRFIVTKSNAVDPAGWGQISLTLKEQP